MIYIESIDVFHYDLHSRLSSKIKIDDQLIEVWIEVERKYGEYLCFERSDAFVVGILNYAMKNNHDISSNISLSEDLFYQLENYFIDTLVKGDPRLYRTIITAPVDSTEIPSANAVGTGISCGIDSLHAIYKNKDKELKQHNITHLCFNNVGSHGDGERAQKLYQERIMQARNFCKDYGFSFVESNSNIMDVIHQDHFLTHTYSSCFAILALQKLYRYYYYASSNLYSNFSVIDNSLKPCGYYELLSLQAFSINNIKIYSEGAALTRFSKTKEVVNYEASYRYLNVCTQQKNNCGHCEKCIRTLLALDALGKLELYTLVFNISDYKRNINKHYAFMFSKCLFGVNAYKEMYSLLKNNISLVIRFQGVYLYIKESIRKSIPEGRCKVFLKKIFRNKK